MLRTYLRFYVQPANHTPQFSQEKRPPIKKIEHVLKQELLALRQLMLPPTETRSPRSPRLLVATLTMCETRTNTTSTYIPCSGARRTRSFAFGQPTPGRSPLVNPHSSLTVALQTRTGGLRVRRSVRDAGDDAARRRDFLAPVWRGGDKGPIDDRQPADGDGRRQGARGQEGGKEGTERSRPSRWRQCLGGADDCDEPARLRLRTWPTWPVPARALEERQYVEATSVCGLGA